jgi:branched-chain amino acid transport system substrate-binding protein
MREKTRWKGVIGPIVGLAILLAPALAPAETTYGVASLVDFSGPFADIFKPLTEARHSTMDWWNAEVGSKLGVKLNYKDYDTHYDAAQVASLWPGILSELKPVTALGVGGPDATALQGRLPADGVVNFMSSCGYGFGWVPGSWVFNPRPTYAHEAGAFFEWLRKKRGGDAPLKIAIISSEAAAAYLDMAKGQQQLAKTFPKQFEIVETVFAEGQPTDLTAQVRRIAKAGAEVISIQTNTTAVVTTKRALQAMGSKIPLMLASHNGLQPSGKALGGLDQMEGDYEAYCMAIASGEPGPPLDFYNKLHTKYGLKAPWNVLTLQGMEQAMYMVRAVEHAATQVGGDKVTGKAVRDAMLSATITSAETFELLPDLKYTNDAPFPVPAALWGNIATVEKGKYKTAASKVPVPTIEKW